MVEFYAIAVPVIKGGAQKEKRFAVEDLERGSEEISAAMAPLACRRVGVTASGHDDAAVLGRRGGLRIPPPAEGFDQVGDAQIGPYLRGLSGTCTLGQLP